MDNAFTQAKTRLVTGGLIDTKNSTNPFDLYFHAGLQGFTANNAAIQTDCSSKTSCSPMSGSEFTFEVARGMTAPTLTTGIGTTQLQSTEAAGTYNFYKMWYNPIAVKDQLTGADYGNDLAQPTDSCDPSQSTPGHVLILCGQVTAATLSFIQDTTAANAILDANGANDYPGITSVIAAAGGSTTFLVDVTYRNMTFFLSNVQALTVDVKQTGGTTLNFTQADPSAKVIDQSWFVGTDKVDDFNCQAATPGAAKGSKSSETCDMILEAGASTAFTATPEPGSLLLLGLGLAALGMGGRVTRRKVTAA